MEHNEEKGSALNLELRCILWEVIQHLWMVLALAVSAACLVFVVSKLCYAPVYTSSTTFVISRAGTSSSAYGNLQSAREMVPTFQSLVKSDLMRKRIQADMGPAYVPGTISVKAVSETNLVTVSATASRPDAAFQTLKSLMAVYPQVGEKALGKVILEVFDSPEYPTRPDNPFAGRRIFSLVFLVTAAAAALAMAIAFYLKDTVKTPDQAKTKLDTPLFSVVYHEKQFRNLADLLRGRRKSMRLSDPAVSFLYEETMKKVSTKLLYKLRSEQAKTILITSTLPREGKSTLAMNLAQDLSHRGKKVLLVEGDLQAPGLTQVLRLKAPLPDWGPCVEQDQDPVGHLGYLKHYGFTVLLNNTPVERSADLLALSHLPQWMESWKQEFDIILVDAPPVYHRSDAELWARCSDLSLLVVRQNVAEAKYINDSIDMLDGYGSGLLGCVYNDAIKEKDFSTYGYGYGYGRYGSYGHYSGYGHYGSYGRYGSYGKYGKYDRRSDPDGSGSEER